MVQLFHSLPKTAELSQAKQMALATFRSEDQSGVTALVPETYTIDETEYVVIDAIASPDEQDKLLSELQELGLEGGEQYGRIVSGFFPVRNINDLADVTSLHSASAASAVANVGEVTTQSDQALRADKARSKFDVDGEGVTVGVLSDSYDTSEAFTSPFFAAVYGEERTENRRAADDVESGDLPDDVEVVAEGPTLPAGPDILDFRFNSTFDEGRAIAQLIHDIAPGADLQFATAMGGQANFANNILALADAGSDVIVDDVIYFAEPMFADGIIAQAAAQVVDEGVAYFSSAGNNSNAGYQSTFVDSGVEGFFGTVIPNFETTTHDWDPGEGVDPVLDFILEGATEITVNGETVVNPSVTSFVLQWADPYASTGVGSPGAATDLDFFLTLSGTDPTQVFFGATDINVGGDPIEILQIVNSGASVELGLAIELVAGPQPSDMRIVAFDRNDAVDAAEYDFTGSTIYGHTAAEGAFGVGAAEWKETPKFGQEPPLLESFSSYGPVTILYDENGTPFETAEIRSGVDFVASQGGNTTFFFRDSENDPDSYPNFFGTSASAPNAAAVAALMLELDPTLSPEDIGKILQDTAIDMDDPVTPGFDVGFDVATGDGLARADKALQWVDKGLRKDKHHKNKQELDDDDGDLIISFDNSRRPEDTYEPASLASYDGGAQTMEAEAAPSYAELIPLTVTFQSASAGYDNAIGIYNTDTREAMLLAADLNDTAVGEMLYIGQLTEFEINTLGFFLLPNADSENDNLADLIGEDLLVVNTADGYAVEVVESGEVLVGTGAPALFSEPHLNPNGFDHFRGDDSPSNYFVLQIEDLVGGGDPDFNDAEIHVHIGAPEALDLFA